MKPINFSPLFAVLLLFSTSGAHAEGSMLRVTCTGDDIGAAVTINGKFKGECPVDMEIKEGTYKLRVEKNDATYLRDFEQDIRIGDGVVKKVEVQLNARLTAAGQQRENQRQERRRIYDDTVAKYEADYAAYKKASSEYGNAEWAWEHPLIVKCSEDAKSFFGTQSGWIRCINEKDSLLIQRRIDNPRPKEPTRPPAWTE